MIKKFATENSGGLLRTPVLMLLLIFSIFLTPTQENALYSFQTNQDVQIELLNLDTSNFPEIVADLRVRDVNDLVITSLDVNEITLWEDQFEQPNSTLTSFGGDSGGVAVTMIMDISSSMDDDLPDAKVSAVSFVNMLNPLDQASLISFDEDITVVQDFTYDKQEVIDAINSLQDGGGTALYDAIVEGARIIRPIEGKKAIVVLADGKDNRSSTDLDELIEQLEAEGIPVYLIGLGRQLDSRSEQRMQEIADASGGLYYRSPTTAELTQIYQEIAFLISNQYYQVTYMAENCLEDGSTRTLEFAIDHGGYHGEFSTQYTAPGYYVTFRPTVQTPPHAGEQFTLSLEIPNSSQPLFNMVSVNFTVSYDPAVVSVVEPISSSLVAGNLTGSEASRYFDATVRPSEGKIDFSIAKFNANDLITGNGALAEITFVCDSTLIDSSEIQFSIEDVSSQNPYGCDVALTIEGGATHTNGMWVWPGDTNHNGVVELSDVLRLGLFWDLQGPARSEPNPIEWKAQSANKYSELPATFADADGGGQINERDLIPIAVNWAQTRHTTTAKAKAVAKTTGAPEGKLSVESEVRPTDNANILKLMWNSSNTNSLAGITFRMVYPENLIDSLAVKPSEKWQDQPLTISNMDKKAGRFALGLMLTSGNFYPFAQGEVVRIEMFSNANVDINQVEFHDIALVGTDGQVTEYGSLNASTTQVAETAMPEQAMLYPAYPNPFNPSTTIQFALAEPGEVSLVVYDILGQKVRTLVSGHLSSGMHQRKWNARNEHNRVVANGVYFISLQANSTYKQVQRVILMK